MPGLTGVVGGQASLARARAAAAALRHFDRYRSRETSIGPRVAIAEVWRDGDREARDWAVDSEAGVALMIAGSAFSTGPLAHRVRAPSALSDYLRRGGLEPLELDGAFVIVAADTRNGRVFVCNDRLGTLPVYYASAGGTTAFAPEAKALFAALGLEPSLSAAGIVSFLNCGYCLGKTTLFEGVHCLEPGSVLEISLATGGCEVRRYWRMVYAPSRALTRRRAAEDALYGATLKAHELAVGDCANGCELLLSGGWDSRGVLAFLDAIGRRPSAAVAWGRTKDIADSDPYLAERLARRFDLPFRFIAYDSDQLLENAHGWCRLSELANDNTGWFAEGATLLVSDYATKADCALVGDEAWGWHGLPHNEREARAETLPPALAPEVAGCLAARAREEHAVRYEAEIDAVLAECGNDHPLDRRDFLYLHGRVARFIFALGYYKELAVEVRRPFLLAGVLDVMAQVPRRFRINKNLYVSMLGRYFPEVASLPLRRAASLPEWARDIRSKPELRRFFLELLDERRLDGALGAVLDPAGLERLKASFFNEPIAAPSSPPPPSPGRHLPLRLKQRLQAVGLHPEARGAGAGYPGRGRADVIRCIAFLSLLTSALRSPKPAYPLRNATSA
ncbi:MAG TPA: hypothetical protein VFV10_12155 [Gammaproteobacteria bacterium]|nr:hypothetical protein [Gammaproteobacteria bacterium]